MSAAPPNTRLTPMSRPMAQAAVPGKLSKMIPAKTRSMTPLNSMTPGQNAQNEQNDSLGQEEAPMGVEGFR